MFPGMQRQMSPYDSNPVAQVGAAQVVSLSASLP